MIVCGQLESVLSALAIRFPAPAFDASRQPPYADYFAVHRMIGAIGKCEICVLATGPTLELLLKRAELTHVVGEIEAFDAVAKKLEYRIHHLNTRGEFSAWSASAGCDHARAAASCEGEVDRVAGSSASIYGKARLSAIQTDRSSATHRRRRRCVEWRTKQAGSSLSRPQPYNLVRMRKLPPQTVPSA
jgi:hypothetical protein